MAASVKSAIKTEDACLLPRAAGPCEMVSPQFYFDTASRSCAAFNYGGCEGNENRFGTAAECEDTCRVFMDRDTEAEDRCRLEKAAGRCRGFFKKYYYNSAAGKCEQFVYTGCQGNENRFDSAEECEASCGPGDSAPRAPRPGRDPAVCGGPVTIGPCKSRVERFYYDAATGVCRQFYYSGCGGGTNMFTTAAACAAACVAEGSSARAAATPALLVSSPCDQPREAGPCRAAKPRWFFSKQSGSCEQFLYGGCRGNNNNFATRDECEARCAAPGLPVIDVSTLAQQQARTTLPESIRRVASPSPPAPPGCAGCHTAASTSDPEVKMVAGHGVKQLTRALLGAPASACGEEVRLGAVLSASTQVVAGRNYLLGLALDTTTGEDCRLRARRRCSGLTFHRPLGCSEAEYADCLQLIRPEEISCEEARVLGPDTGAEEEADPCLMEKVVGRCRGAFNRFYFDAGTKSCQSFKYGGCMGNGNNFSDRRACEAACGRHLPQPRQTPRTMRPTPGNPVCQLPMEAGPCYALMPRFFFNFESRRCEQFIYGGCRGNQNNFASMKVNIQLLDTSASHNTSPPA